MRRWTNARALAAASAAALFAGLAVPGMAAADPAGTNGHGHGGITAGEPGSDIRNVGPDFNQGKPQPLKNGSLVKNQRRMRAFATRAAASTDPAVGDVKKWLAEDDTTGEIYLKDYTLRGIGNNIEVWVANDKAFPEGDCRNDLGLTDITDDQVKSFINEFDNNIYPTESKSFSVPPNEDGSGAAGYHDANGEVKPIGAGQVSDQQADDIVVLVDNVKDANYYDPTSPDGQTYIAGFFWSVFNQYADRNIMTIDAYDWLHRTGANPPDNTGDPAYAACPSASAAPRPHLYEGTFAHEYQHLLEYYVDPDEVSWVNEGLSDYAQSLVGYVDTSVPVTDPTADSHIACFSGFLSDQGYGGPENSLTDWQDQGGPEILCDYGAAYSFMQYLFGHYGADFMSALHLNEGNGLTGLQNVLDVYDPGTSAMDVVHQWAATMALDNVVDGGAKLTGGDPATYSEDTLGAQINWGAFYNDINHDGTFGDQGNEAYSTPGAPPNGSDYVRLGKYSHVGQQETHGQHKGHENQQYFSADKLRSLTFDGSGTLAPAPLEWTVDSTPPDSTTGITCGTVPDGSANTAFYSGCGENFDRAIVHTVDVPANDATLTFRTMYDTEPGWDFGFVQVFDPTQGKYVSVTCDDSTTDHDPGAIDTVQNNLPGFSGDSGGWVTENCDLSQYAGQTVDLAFRYVTDPATNEAGWWVDDVQVGGTSVSDGSSLDGWQSGTQAHPDRVGGYTVQLVAYTDDGSAAWIGQLPLTQGSDGNFHGELSGADLHSVIGSSAQTVAAIVMQDDPTETVDQYAHYTLTANGVTQPGG